VVITAGLLTITRTFSASKNAVKRSAELAEVVLLAQNALWQYEAKGAIAPGQTQGDFPDESPYAWRVNAQAVQGRKLEIVDSEIFRARSSDESLCRIVTYLKEST